eukprot:1798565-Amphidinium_carterae.1
MNLKKDSELKRGNTLTHREQQKTLQALARDFLRLTLHRFTVFKITFSACSKQNIRPVSDPVSDPVSGPVSGPVSDRRRKHWFLKR